MSTVTPLAEGKTKLILPHEDKKLVVVKSKDDLTAGDGAKHDVIEGKAILANDTTCNVFQLLQACGLPVAFYKKIDDTSFLADKCEMIKLEVVVRREAHGSELKRKPYLKKGHVFPRLVVQFFLKTSGKVWKREGQEFALDCDDPLIAFRGDQMDLYDASKPIHGSIPFLGLSVPPDFSDPARRAEMERIARHTFLVLEKGWQILGSRLVDFKVEFGVNVANRGELLLADVIDNDSWRVVRGAEYIDKQVYREGGSLNEVTRKYRLVRDLTGQFGLPNQAVVVWQGSKDDDAKPYDKEFNEKYRGPELDHLVEIQLSAHKKPVQVCQKLARITQEYPDSVIIADVGRSNGLGPVLAANCSVPVITVPQNFQEFADDVWSALRMPSDVPVMTVADPKNAMLAAVRILSTRNPGLYAKLRMQQEERMCNVVELDN